MDSLDAVDKCDSLERLYGIPIKPLELLLIGDYSVQYYVLSYEMHGKIQSSALILAAFVEAVALFGVVVALLQG